MVPVFKIPSGGGPTSPDDDGTTATTTIRTSGSRNGAVGGPDDAECEHCHHPGGPTTADPFVQVTGNVTRRIQCESQEILR